MKGETGRGKSGRSLWPVRRSPARKRKRRSHELRRRLRERLARFRNPRLPRLSQIIEAATEGQTETMTLGTLADRLSGRGLAPVVLVIGFLNIFAIIPGTSTILGLPLLFLGGSLIAGARRLWLPARLRGQSIRTASLRAATDKALPYVRRIERWVRPRYWPPGEWVFYRIFGVIVLIAGMVIVLPIPFGNLLPALVVIALSIGFIERDGLWATAGLVLGTGVSFLLIKVASETLRYLLSYLPG